MKTALDDLAIFGGTPAFREPLHVGRPNIGNRQHLFNRLNDILDRRWLTNNGVYVQEFEQRVAELLGVKHCIAVCNATVGLEIAIRAAELSGEVIIPSFTFIATAHALQWQEITPVFCDIDPQTHNLDPEQVEKLITPHTRGIMGVHVWGRPCAVEQLSEIAERHHLRLLFDAAHAFACSYQDRMIGGYGDAEVFSFHATKFFNTFEGGAIVTNSDALAEKVHLMKNFGFAGYDRVIHLGTNGKMSEISAAMGLTSLESINEFIQVNSRNYQQYRSLLQYTPGIRLITYNEKERNNYQYIILEVDEEQFGVNRNELQEILKAENILARRYFYPGCHQMEPYRSRYPQAGLHLPQTEWLTQRVLSLPTGTAVGPNEINLICQIIHFVRQNYLELKQRLPINATPLAGF